MNTRTLTFILAAITISATAALADGGKAGTNLAASPVSGGPTVSKYQSTARPLGLKIVAPVDQHASDGKSQSFQSSLLPKIQNLCNVNLHEAKALPNVDAVALDPSKLKLATTSSVRAYFVGEGAGYHNSVGFNVNQYGASGPNAKLIFPDASSTGSGTFESGPQSNANPLMPGDFVDMGTFNAGSFLDFFLVSNGANGGTNVFSTNKAANPDHISHVVSFALPDSPYLIISYEDLYGGGDKDYNDVVMAIDIGAANVAHLAGPEPSTFALSGAFLVAAIIVHRRRARRTTFA